VFLPLKFPQTVDLAFLAKHEAVGEVVGIDGVRKALTEFSDEHPDLELKEADTIKAVERFSGKGITLLRGDMFDLDEEMTGGKFDVVFDRASIVAIRPEMREKYVSVMGKLMKPGGSILLVTIDRREGTEEGTSAGPPFSVNENEVRRLYESQDWVQSITKLDEHNEFKDEESKSRWTMQGVTSLFEPCFLIKAKL
jgi:thiopurine S-methyltransferase